MGIIFATGPKVAKVSRAEALALAKENPAFPKEADDITLAELDGHWVAAVHVADSPFGGPADETDSGPGPKSEGPGDTEPPKPDGDGDSDDGGPPSDHKEPDGDEGPPGGDDKGKGGEKHELGALLDLVTQIATALGLPIGGGDEGLVPGEEPGAGGPPGPGAGAPPPPGPPGAGGPPPPDKLQHEKALKPGEVPPGAGPPVGAPAFSHVNPIIARGEKHPWEGLIGVAATFETEERVPDHYGAADVDAELQEVAYGTGFKVKQTKVWTDPNSGHRMAKVLVSAY